MQYSHCGTVAVLSKMACPPARRMTRSPLHLPSKVGVPGRVHRIQVVAAPREAGDLCVPVCVLKSTRKTSRVGQCMCVCGGGGVASSGWGGGGRGFRRVPLPAVQGPSTPHVTYRPSCR